MDVPAAHQPLHCRAIVCQGLLVHKKVASGSDDRTDTGKYSSAAITTGTDAFELGELHYMTHVITADISSNWGIVNPKSAAGGKFLVYKFFPDKPIAWKKTYLMQFVARPNNSKHISS